MLWPHRKRWVLTCVVLSIMWAGIILLGPSVVLAVLVLLKSFGSPLRSDLMSSTQHVTGFAAIAAPLLGPVLASLHLSYKRRHRGRPSHCPWCGWVLRLSSDSTCRTCGWLADRYCRQCGYDLTGNVSGRCPECGTTVESTSKETEP